MADTRQRIILEICRAVQDLGGSADLIALINSWGDTLPDEEILTMLEEYNRTGRVFRQVHDCSP